MITIAVKKLTPTAILPTQSHPGEDAGWDLYAVHAAQLWPGENPQLIRTGIALALPAGYGAWVTGRSGLTLSGVFVHLGLVDAGYRGEIGVMMSISEEGWKQTQGPQIVAGQRIAQLVVQRISPVRWTQTANWEETQRGTNGFGSTGD